MLYDDCKAGLLYKPISVLFIGLLSNSCHGIVGNSGYNGGYGGYNNTSMVTQPGA